MLPSLCRHSRRRDGEARVVALGCSVLALFSLGPMVLAQQGPAGSQPSVTTLTVTTREVLLDVLVTDASGRPVTGLKPADFNVMEEGAPQSIKSLDEHHPMTAADTARLVATPALPPNTFTNFAPVLNTNASTVILLDALDTPLSAQMYLREQLIDYLKNMQPGASIAIFQLDTEMRLIQGFSSDQQMLLAAAKSKRDTPSPRLAINGPNDEYRRVRRQILRDGMHMMGRYLAGFPGRKNLIWFTGEVPLTIFGTGLGNPFRDTFDIRSESGADVDDLADVLTLSRVAVYPIDTRGLQVTRNSLPPRKDRLRQTSTSISRHDRTSTTSISIQSPPPQAAMPTTTPTPSRIRSPRSSTTAPAITRSPTPPLTRTGTANSSISRCPLTAWPKLATSSGLLRFNRDRQEERQLEALRKQNAQSAVNPQDGNNPPSAAQPEAPQPDATSTSDDAGALVRPSKGGLAVSMALGAIQPTEIIFYARLSPDDKVMKLDRNWPTPPSTFLHPPYQDKPFRTYTILIQADAHRIKLTQTADGVRHGAVEIAAVIYDQSGGVVNSLLSTASLDLSVDRYRSLLQSGLPARVQIAIPVKGNFFLRLGIHDVEGDQIGAAEIPVDQVKPGVTGQGLQTP